MTRPKLCGHIWKDGWGEHVCERAVDENGVHTVMLRGDSGFREVAAPYSNHQCKCDARTKG